MNKEIIDSSGKVIHGLIRSENGSIIVSNTKEKSEYIQKKKLYERIAYLENTICIMENSINNIVKKLNEHDYRILNG